ncbi:MAG TPA: hypothetical protein VE526_08745 [Solirubrobacteraceae bacterium]|nr:hypothetical protein [Solirubrobacteraceae bacterium]
MLLLGEVQHLLELATAQPGRGKVEDGARGRRDRQAVEVRDVRGGQGTAAVKTDARASHASAAAHADIDACRRGPADLPRRCGRRVAQDGAVAARENRGPPAAGDADGAMTDGVDAAMEDVEAAVGDADVDLGFGEAEREQLPACDDAALLRGEDGEQPTRYELTLHRRV